MLPEKLLVHHSPFLGAMLNLEAASKSVSLPKDKPTTFEHFVQWLYLGRFHPPVKASRDSNAQECIEAWVLGQKLGCPAFQDHAMLQLIGIHKSYDISPETLRAAYQSSTSMGELRHWAVYGHLSDAGSGHAVDEADQWLDVGKVVKDFAVDVVYTLAKAGLRGPNPYSNPTPFLITDVTIEAAKASLKSIEEEANTYSRQ